MINFSLFGAGRIGQVHAMAINSCTDIAIKNVYDVYPEAAQKIALDTGAHVCNHIDEAINDPEINAFLIATPTDTHCKLITEGVQRKKAVFCEKPIGMNRDEARQCVETVKKAHGLCAMGFHRRCDPSFLELKQRIKNGDIGEVESIIIISRDPDLPPIDYLKTSGGIFRDMMIHDFDMARYLLDENPVSIYATGSCLVNKTLETFGDVDTASVLMRTASGKTITIQNNRRSNCGHDQRIEVLGSKGILNADNKTPTTIRISNADGVTTEQPEYFFLERYKDAYKLEIEYFAKYVNGQTTPLATETDGLNALIIAEAANESFKNGQAVMIKI